MVLPYRAIFVEVQGTSAPCKKMADPLNDIKKVFRG